MARRGKNNGLIIDSEMTYWEAVLDGVNPECPAKIIHQQVLLSVEYYSFDGKLHCGQIVVNRKVKRDVARIFRLIKKKRFPVAKVVPISAYDWDDEQSMRDNNSSAFNYRKAVLKKKLSDHAFGMALDINPKLNPYIKGSCVQPLGAVYNPHRLGAITRDNFIVKKFIELGWHWGGLFRGRLDYQHFYKR